MRRWVLSILVLSWACAAAVSAMAADIATVQQQASGTSATLDSNPVITAILSQPGTVNGRPYTNWTFTTDDGTGGMVVFGTLPAGGAYTPTVGDALTVSGIYSPFHQVPEIESVTAINARSSGNAFTAPRVTSIPAINQSTLPGGAFPAGVAGYYLALNDVSISYSIDVSTGFSTGTFGSDNISSTITDPSNNSMTMYYWPTSYSVANQNLYGMSIPSGAVDMTGFVSVATSTPQFSPITITVLPPNDYWQAPAGQSADWSISASWVYGPGPGSTTETYVINGGVQPSRSPERRARTSTLAIRTARTAARSRCPAAA